MLSLKPTFSRSSFTFIERLLSSSSLSAIGLLLSPKMDEIMSLAAAWMDLGIILLSEVRRMPYVITYMWTLK